MENKRTLIEELKLTEAGSKFVEKIKPLEEEKSRRMTKREAIGRIVDHMTVHHMKEPRAILITEALRNEEEERPKGEWKLRKINQGWEVYCSKCGKGKGFTWDEDFLEDYKKHPQHAYCSYCGADMRESEVEDEHKKD